MKINNDDDKAQQLPEEHQNMWWLHVEIRKDKR